MATNALSFPPVPAPPPRVAQLNWITNTYEFPAIEPEQLALKFPPPLQEDRTRDPLNHCEGGSRYIHRTDRTGASAPHPQAQDCGVCQGRRVHLDRSELRLLDRGEQILRK